MRIGEAFVVILFVLFSLSGLLCPQEESADLAGEVGSAVAIASESNSIETTPVSPPFDPASGRARIEMAMEWKTDSLEA